MLKQDEKYFIPKNSTFKGVQGFNKAIKNETLKISDLELISKGLGKPMYYWFIEDDKNYEIENGLYGKNASDLIKDLRKQISVYVKTQELMNSEIEVLREKLNLKKEGTSGL